MKRQISAERLVVGDTITAWYMNGEWVKTKRRTVKRIDREGAGSFDLIFAGAIRVTDPDEQVEIEVKR